MKSIGGSILFIDERSISVSSKVLPTVKGDSVVYIHSGHPYLAQYHLGSAACQRQSITAASMAVCPGLVALSTMFSAAAFVISGA